MEPLLSTFTEACSRLWLPAGRVSVEEMMVMNYGHCSETVRMRNKPIGSGFKVWALCDSGYMFAAFKAGSSRTLTRTSGGTACLTRPNLYIHLR